MQFIDVHCHLHDSRIVSGIGTLVERAECAGVTAMVSCATMEENFELTARLSERFDSILPFFGIHPWFIQTRSSRWKEMLENYLTAGPSGIGETGLDFTDKTWDRADQILVFEHHLALARELKRPANIHVRKAWDAVLKILKRHGRLPVPGVIHSYSGSADMIPLLESYNLYLSFSGSITYPGARKVVAALQQVSKDRYVLETDTPDICPYLDDVRISGVNEPRYLPDIAQIGARQTGEDLSVFAGRAYDNAANLLASVFTVKKDE